LSSVFSRLLLRESIADAASDEDHEEASVAELARVMAERAAMVD
jgi:hypothetical protein